jgi:predicted nucleotidyltransferase
MVQRDCVGLKVKLGDEGTGIASDVDLAAVIDPAATMDLFRLGALQRRISQLLGRAADLLSEPVEKSRLQARIDRDRQRVF